METNVLALPGLGRAIEAAVREAAGRKLCERLGLPYIGGGAADPWEVYGPFIEALGNGEIDISDDTFKLILLTSSYTPDTSNHDQLTDLSGAEASNYTRPTLTASWSRSGTTVTLDADDALIEASGGNCVFRYLAIYDDSHADDIPVCYQLLDNTPANVTIQSGNSLLLQFHEDGILRGLPAA